jgi:hypothetical protein
VVLGVGVVGVLGVLLTALTGALVWLLMSLPFSIALLLMNRFAPRGYSLAGDGLRIERRAAVKIVPYRTIRGADRMPRPVKGLTVHGSRGIFGHFGRFWNPTIGIYRLFLTNQTTVVWLETDDGLIAVSPDRPDEFVARLEARLALLGPERSRPG